MSNDICAPKENVDIAKPKMCTNDCVVEQSSSTEVNKSITDNVDVVIKPKICTNDCIVEQSPRTEVNKDITENVTRMSMNENVAENLSVDFSSNSSTCVLEFKTIPKSDISKEPNLMAQLNKGLYINALYGTNVDSVNLQVLIDCGATMSLLSRNALEKIPRDIRPTLEVAENKVKFADGSIQQADGLVTLNLKVGNTNKKVNFLVGSFTDEAIKEVREVIKELRYDD